MITTLTLKYRPQKIKELDLRAVRESLEKIFKSGKIPSAFLFSGPKGIGKTSAARIVAKAVNCQKPDGFEPCNECPSCISVNTGTNLDVLEIDAASNRGIDDIRELREKIRLAPSSAKFKVYIIDEVHMLTNEAFNALLKTLEEPPSHALFVLCTTDPKKIPETVVSRCTRIDFKKATGQEIVEKLKYISQKEGFSFSDNDLKKIAQAAEGSFRDAIKILEQAAISSVDEVIGTLGEFQPRDLLSLIAGKQIKQAILWVNKAVEQGANLRILIEEILMLLRQNLLAKFGVEQEGIESKEAIEGLSEKDLKFLIELFSKAAFDLKNAVVPQLPLEMAVIEWGMNNEPKIMEGGNKGNNNEKEEKPSLVHSSKFNIRLEEVLSKWPEVLEKVKPLNHSLQAFLKASRPVSLDKDCLVLEVFYKFHKDQLEQDKCRRIVEKVCSQVFGFPIKLKFILSQKPIENLNKGKSFSAVSCEIPNADEDIVKIAEEIFGIEPSKNQIN